MPVMTPHLTEWWTKCGICTTRFAVEGMSNLSRPELEELFDSEHGVTLWPTRCNREDCAPPKPEKNNGKQHINRKS